MYPRDRASSPPWASFSTTIPSLVRDIPIVIAGLALFYGLISLTRLLGGPGQHATGDSAFAFRAAEVRAVFGGAASWRRI